MIKFWSKESKNIMKMLITCFFAGIAAGTVFANLTFPYRGGGAEVLGIYVMEELKEGRIASKAYFLYLMDRRLRAYLFFTAAGLTAAARPAAVLGMSGMGFLAGAAGSMALLQYGLKGMGVFLAANFPQGIVYIPTIAILLTEVYCRNGKLWRRSGGQMREYLLVSFLCLMGGLAGVLLETFGNPGFLSWVFSLM